MDNAQVAWLLSEAVVLRLLQLGWVLLVAMICATAAAAESRPNPEDAARWMFEAAERDDAAFAFAKAAEEYDEALRLDPTMARAIRAEQRSKSIRARSEGGYEPLVALERVRRDAVLASDTKAIDDLVAAAKAFPPGLVRVETWVLAAEAYSNRLGREDDAVPLWRAITTDAHADAVLVRSALRSLASYYMARGDYAAAAAIADTPNIDPKLAKEVRRPLRRHRMHTTSIVTLAGLGVLAAISIGRASRKGQLRAIFARVRASSRLVIGYATYVAISGAILATGYEAGTSRPFLLFGLVLAPLLFVARAWGAAGSQAGWARGLRAAVCATGAFGAAFLVLEHVDVSYLEGIGL